MIAFEDGIFIVKVLVLKISCGSKTILLKVKDEISFCKDEIIALSKLLSFDKALVAVVLLYPATLIY
jgi:hypothetical protein